MAIEDFYNINVSFYSPVYGSGPVRTVVSWTLFETSTCGEWQTSGNKTVQQDGKQITIDRTIFTDVDAEESYRVVIEDKVYEILSKDDPMRRGHHFEYGLRYLPEGSV